MLPFIDKTMTIENKTMIIENIAKLFNLGPITVFTLSQIRDRPL